MLRGDWLVSFGVGVLGSSTKVCVCVCVGVGVCKCVCNNLPGENR